MLSLIVTLIVIGVLLWLVTTYIPMEATIKRIIVVVVIICVVIYLMMAFGIWGHLHDVPVPQMR
jgi:hypothetical protein